MRPKPKYLFLITLASVARPKICFGCIEVHPYKRRVKHEIILQVTHHITKQEIRLLPDALITFRSQAVNILFTSQMVPHNVLTCNPLVLIIGLDPNREENKSLFVRGSGSIYCLHGDFILTFNVGQNTFSLIKISVTIQGYRFIGIAVGRQGKKI
ncbi:hypothetical protein ACE6H2_020971 [Prunus campanulata]